MSRLQKKSLDYYIINISVLPAVENTAEYYSNLLSRVNDNDMSINVSGDFAYRISEWTSYKNGEAFYGNLAKSVLLRDVKWVKKGTNEKIAYEVPEDHEARKGIYEFLFIPEIHRLILVKSGKIDTTLEDKRSGSVKNVIEFFRIALNEVLSDEGKTVEINVVQKEEIFDRIYQSVVKKLDIKVSYSNPGLDGDRDPSIDEMLRDAHAGSTRLQVESDNTGEIDTSSKIIRGFLDLAQTDGSVVANIINEDGKKEKIVTSLHPKIDGTVISINKNESSLPKFIAAILSKFRDSKK